MNISKVNWTNFKNECDEQFKDFVITENLNESDERCLLVTT